MAPSKELKEKRERVQKELKEREKELYSKECVAHSINFVVDKASKEVTTLKDYERFSCYLATILARDKEVVAVWLRVLPGRCEIYLSKNFAWDDTDTRYINQIMSYLKNISANPTDSTRIEVSFTEAVMDYCFAKLQSRYNKLAGYVEKNGDSEHVKSLQKFFSTNISAHQTSPIMTSSACNKYYKEVKDKEVKDRNDEKDGKDKSSIPSEFLELIKKVGSYAGSMTGIVECARNKQYKPLFSNSIVFNMKPVIINQPIYSWKDTIKRFIDEDEYEGFMKNCLKKTHVVERMKRIYTDNDTKQLQLLDGGDVKQCIYLHAEMNILTHIIDNGIGKIGRRNFIAVSKKCCYLCELYLDFARDQGYKINVPGYHKKIYSGWKLPNVKDDNFKIRSLEYILKRLDRIIEQKLEHHTRSLLAGPDSGGNSPDQGSSGGGHMDVVFIEVGNRAKKLTPIFK